MSAPLVLISHALCPYVQRAAIVLAEKGVAFERRDIDLAHKPDWFLAVSPLGKTPVLLVDGEPIFESAVICEYLEDTTLPKLHPSNALLRARHRAWMEFGSNVLSLIAAFYSAPDEAGLQAKGEFVKKQKLWFRHKPPCDGTHLLLTAAHRLGCLIPAVFKDREKVVHFVQAFIYDFSVLCRKSAEFKVLTHRQFGEEAPSFRNVTQAFLDGF